MVQVSVQQSFLSLGWMLWHGFAISAFWDSTRYAFKKQGTPTWVLFGYDFFAAWFASIYLFQAMRVLNGGEFRLVFFLTAGAGCWIYFSVFKRMFRQINFYIVRLLCFVIQCCKRFLVFFVINPVFWFASIILKLLYAILFWISSLILPKMWLTKCENRIRILLQRMTNFDKRRQA